MPDRKLKISAHPESRGVLVPGHIKPVITGNGDWNYLCPVCDRVLLARVPERLPILNGAIKCVDCATVSDIPGGASFA